MSDQSTQKNRIGRPSKDPTGGRRPTITFRCRKSLQDKIQQAAAAAGRSISEEVECRLADSFGPNEAMKAAIRKVLAEQRLEDAETPVSNMRSFVEGMGYRRVQVQFPLRD